MNKMYTLFQMFTIMLTHFYKLEKTRLLLDTTTPNNMSNFMNFMKPNLFVT